MSSNVCTVRNRVPGDVGLNLRIGITVILEESGNGNQTLSPLLSPLQELGQLLAFPQRDVGLLPVGPASEEPPLSLHLAVRQRGAHVLDLRSEQLLDRAPDIDLVRVPRHFE